MPRSPSKSKEKKKRFRSTEQRRINDILKFVKADDMVHVYDIVKYVEPTEMMKIVKYVIMELEDDQTSEVMMALYASKRVEMNLDVRENAFGTPEVYPPLYYAIERYEQEPHKIRRWEMVHFLIYRTETQVAYGALSYLASLGSTTCGRAENVCKSIIAASDHAIITALKCAEYMRDMGKNAFAEQEDYFSVAASFEETAQKLFDEIEHDHIAAIVLEVPDPAFNTPIAVAIDTESKEFLSSPRVQRILNSMWATPNYLKSESMHTSNAILPLDKLADMIFEPAALFFTPMGSYITKYLMQIIFLVIFSLVVADKRALHDEPSLLEWAMWGFGLTELSGELLEIRVEGLNEYFRDAWNTLDGAVVVSIVTIMGLRLHSHQEFLDNGTEFGEFQGLTLLYQALTSITAIALWMRVFSAFIMHPTVGPLLKMVMEMMTDVKNFIYIVIIVIAAFAQALYFFIGGHVDGYETAQNTLFSVFRSGVLGDFDLDGILDIKDDERRFVAEVFYVVYVVLAVVVLFNLIVAMMATTYGKVEEDMGKEYLLMRSRVIHEFEKDGNQINAPLNVIAEALYLIYYIVSTFCSCFLDPAHREKIQASRRQEQELQEGLVNVLKPGNATIRDHKTLDTKSTLEEKEENVKNEWHCAYCHQHNALTKDELRDNIEEWLNDVHVDKNKDFVGNILVKLPVLCNQCFRVRTETKNYDTYVREKCSVWVFTAFVYPIIFLLVFTLSFLKKLLTLGAAELDSKERNAHRREKARMLAMGQAGGFNSINMMSDMGVKAVSRPARGTTFLEPQAERLDDSYMYKLVTKKLEQADSKFQESYEPDQQEMIEAMYAKHMAHMSNYEIKKSLPEDTKCDAWNSDVEDEKEAKKPMTKKEIRAEKKRLKKELKRRKAEQKKREEEEAAIAAAKAAAAAEAARKKKAKKKKKRRPKTPTPEPSSESSSSSSSEEEAEDEEQTQPSGDESSSSSASESGNEKGSGDDSDDNEEEEEEEEGKVQVTVDTAANASSVEGQQLKFHTPEGDKDAGHIDADASAYEDDDGNFDLQRIPSHQVLAPEASDKEDEEKVTDTTLDSKPVLEESISLFDASVAVVESNRILDEVTSAPTVNPTTASDIVAVPLATFDNAAESAAPPQVQNLISTEESKTNMTSGKMMLSPLDDISQQKKKKKKKSKKKKSKKSKKVSSDDESSESN